MQAVRGLHLSLFIMSTNNRHSLAVSKKMKWPQQICKWISLKHESPPLEKSQSMILKYLFTM